MISPTWEPDFPEDVRAIAEPMLMRWLSLLPTWCQEFVVRYVGGEEDATLKIVINHRNRWALLKITGLWLGNPEADREKAIVHELIHVGLEPLHKAADRIVEQYAEEGSSAHNLASVMLRDGLECSTDDLARSIVRLMEARA